MADTRTTDNGINNLTFEDVDPQTFLGDNSALRTIIAKIANNNQTVITGIESLINEELIFRSFDRALSLLITAKNEQNLQRVEAALQITINEVRNFNAKGSPYMGNKKTSLYLYTLQTLIFNLGKWKFPDKKRNTFKPSLLVKLQYAKLKCAYANVGYDVIRDECFTSMYQQPYDKNLQNFEFLDEQRLDSFINRLRKYEKTHNPGDLYEPKSFDQLYASAQKSNTIEKVINYLKVTFGVKDLNMAFYQSNYNAINAAIGKFVGSNELQTIYCISEALKNHLQSEEQFKATLHGHDGRIM